MLVDHDDPTSNYIVDEEQMMEGSHFPTPITTVANLIDSYLAEVAPDVNLKLAKFQSLAAAVPEYARSLDDGIYRAIDIYLKVKAITFKWFFTCIPCQSSSLILMI
jgi:hypothetical protein